MTLRQASCSRILILWLFFLSFSMPLHAEVTASFVSKTGYDKGILWKITSPKKRNSYLLGTIHVEDPRVINLPQKVLRTIHQSSSMSLEVIPDPQLQQKTLLAMLYQDGRNLRQVVGEKLYKRSVEALRDHGIPEQFASQMKPWAVMTYLSLPRVETGEFLDKRLYTIAKQRGMKTYALETFEEQISVFDKLSRQEEINMLKDTLDELASIPAQIEQLTQAWLQRDLNLIESLAKQQINESTSQAFMASILDKRNQLMVERMQPRLKEGRAFIAVGALHLPGEKGLLHLLSLQGYKIEAVY